MDEQENHETIIWVSIVIEDACLRKMFDGPGSNESELLSPRARKSIRGLSVGRQTGMRSWGACVRQVALGLEGKTWPQRIFFRKISVFEACWK